MKKNILKIEGGRWFVNGKKSDQWSWDEQKFVNKFIRQAKKNPSKITKLEASAVLKKAGCNPLGFVYRFLRKIKI